MEEFWIKLYDRDGPLGHNKRPARMLLFVF